MNLKGTLAEARALLAARGIEDTPLEAEVLLRHALGIDRVNLYSSLDRQLTHEELENFHGLIGRRLSGEPSAYITGHREFYGLDFLVTRDVLVPRPETELLVEKALALARNRPVKTIADIGTGSGIIAACMAVNLPTARIYAVDRSAAALEIARRNFTRHGVTGRVTPLLGDLLTPLPAPVDLIAANLPYVKSADCAPLPDPHLALDGGLDGLDQIRRLADQTRSKMASGGALLLEIGQAQDRAVVNLLHDRFPDARIEVYEDPAWIKRVVVLERGE